jgi:hypothetical protein
MTGRLRVLAWVLRCLLVLAIPFLVAGVWHAAQAMTFTSFVLTGTCLWLLCLPVGWVGRIAGRRAARAAQRHELTAGDRSGR